jgi:hypothetical protein
MYALHQSCGAQAAEKRSACVEVSGAVEKATDNPVGQVIIVHRMSMLKTV